MVITQNVEEELGFLSDKQSLPITLNNNAMGVMIRKKISPKIRGLVIL
jgi:hypothetical protein